MAAWDDVSEIALALPETDERPSRGHAFWRVKGKGFVWQRPLRGTDLKALGEAAPQGPLVLERIDLVELREIIVEAWLCRAPRRLAESYLAEELDTPPG
ncbi:MAG TPA: hypothetical protein VII87_06790 [Solirubrobacteraceae bacterium]|jgi:hypothetical protein